MSKIDKNVRGLWQKVDTESAECKKKLFWLEEYKHEISTILTAKKFAWLNIDNVKTESGNYYIIRRAFGNTKMEPVLAKWSESDGWEFLVGNVNGGWAENATIEVYVGVE